MDLDEEKLELSTSFDVDGESKKTASQLFEHKDTIKNEKRALLDKTRQINQDSRNAIKNTLEGLYDGNIDISKLAVEANAVVVHSLPLPGWYLANTSMNNKEIDVTKLESDEKINIIKEKNQIFLLQLLQLVKKLKAKVLCILLELFLMAK